MGQSPNAPSLTINVLILGGTDLYTTFIMDVTLDDMTKDFMTENKPLAHMVVVNMRRYTHLL